jgi:preprotein translocase subunit YajC
MPSANHILLTLMASGSTKPATSNSSGSIIFLLVIVVLFFLMYRFFMKPRQRAAQQQRDTLTTLEPGDEVLTGAGIFGTVQHIQGDRVTLWTGTGSTVTVLRRTIARKLDENEYEEPPAEEAEHEDDSWGHDEQTPEASHDGDGETDHTETGGQSGSANGTGGGSQAGGTMKATGSTADGDFTWPSGASPSDTTKAEDEDR